MFHVPDAAVLPANAEEIAAIVKLANEHDFPITVRSGGTSLATGYSRLRRPGPVYGPPQ